MGKSANYVSFDKVSRVVALARSPGTWTDKSNPGFGMRVSPKGKAVWFMRFYDAVGVERTKTLGPVHTDTNDNGLGYQQALELFKHRQQQEQKSTQEKDRESILAEYETFEKAFHKFLKDRRKKDGSALAGTTKQDYIKVYSTYMRTIQNWPMADTKAFQWKKFLESVYQISPSKAVSCKSIISGVYNHLMSLDIVDANPIAKVTQLRLIIKPAARSSRVATLDIPAFFDAVETGLTRQNSRDAVLLLTLTGTRLRAGLGMRWEHLNLDEGYYLVLPGQEGWKGFSGVFPLSNAVCDLLRNRRERRNKNDGGYVFPKRHGQAHPPHQSKISDALKVVASSFDYQPIPHDLRRTFASIAQMVLRNESHVGELMTHKWASNGRGEVVTHTAITRQYILSELVSVRARANAVVNFMFELAGKRPMSDKTKEILSAEGFSPGAFRILDVTQAEDDVDSE